MELLRDQRTSPSIAAGRPRRTRERRTCRIHSAALRFDRFGGVGRSARSIGGGVSCVVLMARGGRVAVWGCSVGACGTARKPLAALGLGLTAALRVRAVRAVA